MNTRNRRNVQALVSRMRASVRALAEGTPAERRQGAKALRGLELKWDWVFCGLTLALRDRGVAVDWALATSMRQDRSRCPPSAQALVEAMFDSEDWVRIYEGVIDPAWHLALSLGAVRPMLGVIPVLVEALVDDDAWVRRYATEALHFVRPSDEHPHVRRSVGDREEDGAFDADGLDLHKKLESEAGEYCSTWLRDRPHVPDDQVVQTLGGALSDSDAFVRRLAAWALCQLTDRRLVDYEKVPVTTRDSGSMNAFTVLLEIGNARTTAPGSRVSCLLTDPVCREALSTLVTAIEDPDAIVRGAAVLAWGRTRWSDREGDPCLLRAFSDTDPFVRGLAAEAWRQSCHRTRMDLCWLEKATKDKDRWVRRLATRALQQSKRGAGDAVSVAANALHDRDAFVRLQAVEALKAIAPLTRRALGTVAEALKDPDPAVRASAIDALEGFACRWGGSHLRAFSRIWKRVQVAYICRAATPALVEALMDQDKLIAKKAAAILGGLETASRDVARGLVCALNDPTVGVRVHAIRALGRTRADGKEVGPALARAARDPDRRVRRAAVYALGTMKVASALSISVFVGALQDTDTKVRRNAADVLGRLGRVAAGAIPALLTALRCPNRGPYRTCGQWHRTASINEALAPHITKALVTIGAVPGEVFRALVDSCRTRCSGIRSDVWSALDVLLGTTSSFLARKEFVKAVGYTSRLGCLSPPAPLAHDTVRAFMAAMEQDNKQARGLAAAILASRGAYLQEYFDELVTGMRDGDAWVREMAVYGCRRLGPTAERALPVLAELMTDRNEDVRREAAECFRLIDEDTRGDDEVSLR